MRITADELKNLTRLNSHIAARKWTHAYAQAAHMGNDWPRITNMGEYRSRYRRRLSSGELTQLPMLYADSK